MPTPTSAIPLEKRSLARLISDDVRTQIVTGAYGADTLLPTEAALAEHYGTNRNTLREAMRILETQGFVKVRQGEGVRVCDIRARPTIETVALLLAEPTPTPEWPAMLADLLTLRRLLAIQIARRAAGVLSVAAAAEIRALLPIVADPAATAAQRTATDLRVLELLVRATGSVVYAALFNSLYRIIAAAAARVPGLTTVPDDYARRLEHIVDRLLAADGDAAAAAMGALCDRSDAVLLSAVPC